MFIIKPKALLIIIFSFAFLNLLSNTPDSLLRLAKKNEANRDYIYIELAQYYLQKNDSTCLEYANKAIEQKIIDNNYQVSFESNTIIGNYYLRNNKNKKAEKYFNNALSFSGTLSQKSQTYVYLAQTMLNMGNPLQSLEYLRLAKNGVDNNHLGFLVYLNEGIAYYNLNDKKAAETRWENALKMAEMSESNNEKAQIYFYYGLIKFDKLQFPESFYYVSQSIVNYKTDTLNTIYALGFALMGDIYLLQNNVKKAVAAYNHAYSVFLELDQKANIALLANKIGNAKLKMLKYTQAINWFFKVEADSLNAGTTQIVNCYIGLSQAYLAINNLNVAQKYFDKAIAVKNLSKNTIDLFNIEMQQAKLLASKKIYNQAVKHANNASNIAGKTGSINQLAQAYQLLSDIYYEQRQYKLSAESQKLAYSFIDSLNNCLHNDEIRYIQNQHEANYQKQVIDILTMEKNAASVDLESSKAVIEKQKGFVYFALAMFLLIVITVIVLLLWLNQKRKAHNLLVASNKQIAQQKEEIEVQRQYLLDINAELEKLSIVARETYNGIKILNDKGKVLWINEGYTRMYGYRLDEVQAIDNLMYVNKDANVDINQLVNVWYGDKKPISFESKNTTKQGHEIWVQTTLTPILDSKGKIDKMIAIDTDITQLKIAEEEIRVKNFDITSSISYAKRIQEAMLSPFNIITEQYPDSFCFYKPKSIVSGDFYWMSNRHGRLIIVCADSTGHGVPGAFMSLIGISFLNKIVNEKGFVSPSIILNRLRMNIISHLHQTASEHVAGDGMDVSVISIDQKNMLMEYAGAMNPVYVIRQNNLMELKPDRMPVGFFDNENRPFSSTSISLKPNDQIVLFTDGYYDQFGGNSSQKMKSSRFKEIIISCAHKTSVEQHKIIESSFEDWRGNNQQVDDVLIMGIKIN